MQRVRRYHWRFVWVCLLLLSTASPMPSNAMSQAERCFSETEFCVQGRFLDYWLANGDLARNGYPLTSERREVLEDGKEYTVQYFERVRMELHSENAPPFDVLLGQFGRQVFRESFRASRNDYVAALAPAPEQPGEVYFRETGHNVSQRFAAYWRVNGGLAQFGYPLAEEQTEYVTATADQAGQSLRVQYFERGRLEYHPENTDTPYEVLLGQFGRVVLGWHDVPLATPFVAVYNGDATLRDLLGPPTIAGPGPARMVEVLPFEHGLVLHYPATPQSQGGDSFHLLCGTPDAGYVPIEPRTASPGVSIRIGPDEQLPAGGPGPRAGTYVPGGPIGVLWARGVFRDCLGYATAPASVGQETVGQGFERGIMLALPARGEIYALYFNQDGDSPTSGYYQRYPLPK